MTRSEVLDLMMELIEANHRDVDREVTITKGVMSPL
jgi:hypothetical protein